MKSAKPETVPEDIKDNRLLENSIKTWINYNMPAVKQSHDGHLVNSFYDFAVSQIKQRIGNTLHLTQKAKHEGIMVNSSFGQQYNAYLWTQIAAIEKELGCNVDKFLSEIVKEWASKNNIIF